MRAPTLAGYDLARMRIPGLTFIFYGLLAALMVPTEIILLPLFVQFRDLHLLNMYPTLILPDSSLGMAFSTYLLRGFFKTLPSELAEAARIDGAGEFATFWRVMLPPAAPGIATIAISRLWAAGASSSWRPCLSPIPICDPLQPVCSASAGRTRRTGEH